ncbi:restriction endonuclease subunit S [Billgrantia desiderata]|uniref:restriction endonuclease subunit S n=1 Tax=Billgrantia desiderata TaxID=52021 RepID=UPI001F257EA2|nr:restriction endonuclease subunit S [Halomonas desiderata]MCE8011803.1 restriction endonuclease subunit S [Halomonas desiderata]
MSERGLPEGWINITLGELCELSPKQTLDDELEVGFMPMSGVPTTFHVKPEFENRKWEAVKKGYTQFKNGDVLFAKITPCFENGKATVVEGFPSGWGAGSTEYHVLRPRAEAVDPRLLLALVRTKGFLKNGELNMSGSVGHKRVPKEFVGGYPFPLMALAEQKVIADKLDGLLAQVNNLKARLGAIPAILKRFRQSVLEVAVSGRLTEEWGRKKGLSLEWAQIEVGMLAKKEKHSLCIGPFGSRLKVKDYRSSGHPLVFVREIRARCFGDSTTKFIDGEKFAELASHRARPGDLLITKMGDPPGDVAFYPVGRPEGVITADCIKLDVDKEVAAPEYVYYAMQSPIFRKRVVDASAGVAQKKVNLKNFKAIPFDLPGLEEQAEIVRRVDQLFAFADQIEQQVKNAQARVDKLTQSILAKAFRGELTAEWRAANPELVSGENSAAALLNKIKNGGRRNKVGHSLRGGFSGPESR